jgi:hypothetical protein
VKSGSFFRHCPEWQSGQDNLSRAYSDASTLQHAAGALIDA